MIIFFRMCSHSKFICKKKIQEKIQKSKEKCTKNTGNDDEKANIVYEMMMISQFNSKSSFFFSYFVE